MLYNNAEIWANIPELILEGVYCMPASQLAINRMTLSLMDRVDYSTCLEGLRLEIAGQVHFHLK
ncbi:MAG: hypothetical protein A4E53_04339 [Pelotomaculum sp. PtaB.Bin104]|nr:MAG: hypothetical protein A4E53_04339 [Pelotomaculum sp. PtaB.Bin104]